MLTILHATCQTALERLAGGRTTDSEIAADLKSILERTRIELSSGAWSRQVPSRAKGSIARKRGRSDRHSDCVGHAVWGCARCWPA